MMRLRALGAISILFICGCSATRTAPRFEKPSTAAIGESHKKAISHVQAAKAKVAEIEKANPTLTLQIAAITVDLDSALKELNTSEGARLQLDAELKQQTEKANILADAFDKSNLRLSRGAESVASSLR
jgi:hypothetical protein